MKSPRVYLPLGLLCAIFLAVILYPVFMKHPNVPQWRREADRFVDNVGVAMKQYRNGHNGQLPPSLKDLYPKYIKDSRIRQDVVVFLGEKLVIKYYRSAKLGDRYSVIVELNLARKLRPGEFFRPICLYGDMNRTGYE